MVSKSSRAGTCISAIYCYDAGDGVTKDTAKAIEWYKKAAAQGQEDAKKELNEYGIY